MFQPASHDYYYSNEADQYTFYRLPKVLFTDSRYKNLSDGAKILYGLMLDRMGLSVKNGWLDDENRVYIYFTLEDVQEHMNCKQDKGVKLLAELDAAKGVGLIERIKQGQGRPARIYVKKFFNQAEVLTSEKPKSGVRENRSLDFGKSECSNTDINHTEFNDTEYPSIYQARIGANREIIQENIEYEYLCGQYDPERVDEIVELMLEAISSKRLAVRIGGDDFPSEIVRSRLFKVRYSHVEYVFDCLDKNTSKIRNIKNYLLTALYNAPATIDSYYRAEVQHDLYGSSP